MALVIFPVGNRRHFVSLQDSELTHRLLFSLFLQTGMKLACSVAIGGGVVGLANFEQIILII